MQTTPLKHPKDWKRAIQKALAEKSVSRYAFIRQVTERGICSQHTAECLLADEGTITGDRNPSFPIALSIAELAGFEMTLVRKEPTE